MIKKIRKLGISGGTFDPIHYGHLIIAEDIRESFKLDKVIFIPSGMPPHKDITKVTDARHRYNMVRIAIDNNPYFEASSIELDRPGYTYTVDTLIQLKEIYGEDTKLYFITGADVVPELLTWKNYQKIFKLCEFITVLRPGYKKSTFIEAVEKMRVEHGAIIHLTEAPLIGISSTIIRTRMNENKSIKYLVPEKVEKYIFDNMLYVFK
ncbi:MAG TPA: nicotinate-nucleotide adenylyltransferase [Clostridiaceae bacterium]|nr:nicotinate-nucleotide adenylyltransferase [Clostridiaceae bacterium]